MRFQRGHQMKKVAWWKTLARTLLMSHMTTEIHSTKMCVELQSLVIWWDSSVSFLHLLCQLETQRGKIIKSTTGSAIYSEVGGGPSFAPLWKMNVNGTLKAKVKTVIRIQPTAPLIYSQSVAHLWIYSILRPDFHGGMSRETAACPRGDT